MGLKAFFFPTALHSLSMCSFTLECLQSSGNGKDESTPEGNRQPNHRQSKEEVHTYCGQSVSKVSLMGDDDSDGLLRVLIGVHTDVAYQIASLVRGFEAFESNVLVKLVSITSSVKQWYPYFSARKLDQVLYPMSCVKARCEREKKTKSLTGQSSSGYHPDSTDRHRQS
jgi:hypothetical protein